MPRKFAHNPICQQLKHDNVKCVEIFKPQLWVWVQVCMVPHLHLSSLIFFKHKAKLFRIRSCYQPQEKRMLTQRKLPEQICSVKKRKTLNSTIHNDTSKTSTMQVSCTHPVRRGASACTVQTCGDCPAPRTSLAGHGWRLWWCSESWCGAASRSLTAGKRTFSCRPTESPAPPGPLAGPDRRRPSVCPVPQSPGRPCWGRWPVDWALGGPWWSPSRFRQSTEAHKVNGKRRQRSTDVFSEGRL